MQDSMDDSAPLTVAEKLTEWPKEPTVMTLKEDLEASKPSHDAQLAQINDWIALRDVTGKERPPKRKGRSSVQPRLVRRQAEWRYSALAEPFLSSENLFDIKGTTFEDVKAAEQNSILLNWQFRTKIDREAFIDEYVRTATDEGTCIVRLGWERETIVEQEEVPVFTLSEPWLPEQIQELQNALQLKQANPRGFNEQVPENVKQAVAYFEETGQAAVATQTGTKMEDVETVVENRPTLEVMDFDNVFIDPTCNGDLDKANFVIVSYETSKAELMKDSRYKNLKSVNWEGATILAEPDHATNSPEDFNFKDSLRKRVVAYEYWGFYDVEGTGELKPIVATWIGDVMIRMEENPFPDKKVPFVVVRYMPRKRSVVGEPDAALLGENQRILGATTRGMIDLLGRSANAQQGYAKGFLDVTNRRRFESGQDYEFNPSMGDPRLAIFQHTYPEIPNSAITLSNIQNQEAEAMTGVKAFSGGLSGDAYGNVATNTKGVLDAASKREMNILRRLSKGLVKIATKIIAMNAVFLTEEEVVRVTNEQYVTIKREDLRGNFDLECDISTPEVDEARAQDLGFMLQTIGPDMDFNLQKLILTKIAKLKRIPDLAKELEMYQPQPDPIAEQMKQLEVQKLQLELEELKSKIALNNAKARAEESDADLKDQDFVDQSSGRAHAQEMERIQGQAEANQNLEIQKAVMQPHKEGESSPDVAAGIGFKQLTGNGVL